MAESLFFRKGTLAELNSSALVNGSVNFTTDEPAIYLDITNDEGNVERRRIGDIIQFETIDDFTVFRDAHNGNIPTTAFYYIVGNSTTGGYVNALLKWTGTEYIQINSVNDVTADLNTINGKITTLENNQATISSTLTEQGNTLLDLENRVTELEENGSGESTVPESLTQQVDTNTAAITTLQNVVAEKADQTDVDNLSTAMANKAETSTVTAIDERLILAEKEIDDVQTNTAEYETRITNLENASAEFITEEEVTALIEKDIAAANAMTFKEIQITKYSDLPIAQVKVGDTYVVTSNFSYNDENYYAGDLLVASGTEENGYITDISWIHVETGYIPEQQPKLTGDNDKLYLSSHIASAAAPGDLGIITVNGAENSNIKTTVSDNTITISMEWGSF